VQTVPVAGQPGYMVYDGANLWVPNYLGDSITVVRASSGTVVATIAGDASNRLNKPVQAAFDGERILVTNQGNDSVTLFRAADLSLIANVQLAAGSVPYGACSDGIHFWVTLRGSLELLRL
jgi:DNA-binding beta-propeller fold protein YncE